VYLHNL